MARVRVMYWKEIPVQVQAQGDDGQVSKPLDARFQEATDAIAMFDGSAKTDAYLDAWDFGEFVEVDGTADEAAEEIAHRFNSSMPADFVKRIRDLHTAGERDERPGSIDSWAGVEGFGAV